MIFYMCLKFVWVLSQLQASHRWSHDRYRFQDRKNLNPFSFRIRSDLPVSGPFAHRNSWFPDQPVVVGAFTVTIILTMSSSSKISWTFGQTIRNLWINRNWFIGLCKWVASSKSFRCCIILSIIRLSVIWKLCHKLWVISYDS